MRKSFLPIAIVAVLAGVCCAQAQSPNASQKTCHREQQCHWENFKKICVWVTVCR
jgi:hypothetical protein